MEFGHKRMKTWHEIVRRLVDETQRDQNQEAIPQPDQLLSRDAVRFPP